MPLKVHGNDGIQMYLVRELHPDGIKLHGAHVDIYAAKHEAMSRETAEKTEHDIIPVLVRGFMSGNLGGIFDKWEEVAVEGHQDSSP